MAEAGGPGGRLTGRLHVPDVNRRAGALPSLGTSQRCVDVGGALVSRLSLMAISNESLNRSGPAFVSGSSAVANAIVRPSGDHANCCTPIVAVVSARTRPLSTRATNTCDRATPAVGAPARHAIWRPSGDHRGLESATCPPTSAFVVPFATSTRTSVGS